MTKSLYPILRYLLACTALFLLASLSPFAIGDRFYRFDRAHIFLGLFYSALFVVGVALRVHRPSPWRRTVLLGALAGLLSGLLAQAVVILVNGVSNGVLRSVGAMDILFSLATGSLVFLTPAWGIVSASASKVLSRRHLPGAPS